MPLDISIPDDLATYIMELTRRHTLSVPICRCLVCRLAELLEASEPPTAHCSECGRATPGHHADCESDAPIAPDDICATSSCDIVHPGISHRAYAGLSAFAHRNL